MQKQRDMTSGRITPTLIQFAIPVLLGNLFQQFYNTVDAVIVGQVLGKDALAAVGVANPIMSIAIFFLFGVCIGIGIILAQLYGAKAYDQFKIQTSTSLIGGGTFTIVFSILCMALSLPLLKMIKTPEAIIGDANGYLQIIFAGLIFSFLYNFYASALRATGDSRTPFLFLLISSLINVGLDLLFVAQFGMGVRGAALATIIAQGISSLLCVAFVYFKKPLIALKRREWIFKKSILVNTIRYSWASALQQTFVYIGRLLIQGVVNPFGTDTIAAFNAAMRVEAIITTPFDAMSNATSTFCAQNVGAKRHERVFAGYKRAALIDLAVALAASALLYALAPQVMYLFVDEAEMGVITIGAEFLRLMCFFYFLLSQTFIMQGMFRGVGKLKITLFTTTTSIVIRVLGSFLLVPRMGLTGVCYASALGWVFMIAVEVVCMRRYYKSLQQQAQPA
nr:MATE family efflux transporter [Maliibacterium massiliense]